MKNLIKRLVPGIFIVLFLVTTITGCTQKTTSNDGGTSNSDTASTRTVNGVDISKFTELKMYLIGDKPTDADMVYQELNKLIERDLNAKLNVDFLAFSDYTQKYPLVLASGEDVDLIYTSTWCFYAQEATKGAFVEITEDLLKKYMPMTYEKQPGVSFEQGKINGKTYFVPNNLAGIAGSVVVIRGDLREKYNIPQIKTLDDLKMYYEAVAKNEKGIFPYAASQNNNEMKVIAFYQKYDVVRLNGVNDDYAYIYTEGDVNADTVKWIYDMPEYLEFLKEMKAWADMGFWSKNAIANSTQPRDAFENGTSASLVWNLGTVGNSARKVNQSNPDWKPEIYDVNPGAVHTKGLYTGDGMAVVATSKNIERSFLLLDRLKFDQEYYELFRFGIKGKHWEAVGADMWRPAADQNNYPFGGGGTWGVKNELFEKRREDELPVERAIYEDWKSKVDNWKFPYEGFIFDDSKVKNEVAALNSLKAKYIYLLELGLVDDVEKTLAEFKAEAIKAGKEKIDAELRRQLEDYLKNR